MPSVGFEPTIPMFERAKTVHALDRAVNVIGIKAHNGGKKNSFYNSRRRNYTQTNGVISRFTLSTELKERWTVQTDEE
jgi:hypothetical protein